MCTKLQVSVNSFPVICFLMEVNTVCGHTRLKIVSSAYFNVEIFRRIASSVKRLRILVFKSCCQHFTQFGKYGLQPRVQLSSGDNQDK